MRQSIRSARSEIDQLGSERPSSETIISVLLQPTMQLFQLFLLSLSSIQLLLCMDPDFFTGIELGYGIADAEGHSYRKCVRHFKTVNFSGIPHFEGNMRKACIEHKRHRRGSLTASVASGVLLLALGGAKGINATLDRQNKKFEKDADYAWIRMSLAERLNKGYGNTITYSEWERLQDALFGGRQLFRTLGFMEVDVNEVLDQLEIPAQIGWDATQMFEYRFGCQLESSTFSVDICGEANDRRKHGVVKRVAPIGGFVNNGSFFRYYKTPGTVLFPSQGRPISIRKCSSTLSFYNCSYNGQEKCGVDSPEQCGMEVAPTRDGVFIMPMESETFIATTHKRYLLIHNGTKIYGEVPDSGQFMMRLPHGYLMMIGRTVVEGKSWESYHFKAVPFDTPFRNYDHSGLKELRETMEKTGERLPEEHWEKAHNSIPLECSKDVIFYLLRTHPIVRGLIILLFIVFSLYCLYWAARYAVAFYAVQRL